MLAGIFRDVQGPLDTETKGLEELGWKWGLGSYQHMCDDQSVLEHGHDLEEKSVLGGLGCTG